MASFHRFYLAALSFAVAGCNQVTVADDIDLDLDWKALVGPSDELHSPYVIGAKMGVYARSTDNKEKMSGWTLTSSNPTVFQVGTLHLPAESGSARADGQALTEGSVKLTVRDAGGGILHEQTIDVKKPDRVQLYAHGLLLLGHPDAEAQVTEARIRAGGTATYLTRYFVGKQELYGNGTLSVTGPASVGVNVVQSFLFEDRDWLQLSPSSMGNLKVSLKAASLPINDLPLVVVGDGDVANIRLMGMDESHASKGTWLVVLAQALDTQTQSIYGVDYAWQVDGQTQTGFGDLYRYEFDPAVPKRLGARFAKHNASAMIHWGGGFVDSTNRVGCSAAPGAPAGRGAAAGMSGVAVLVAFGLRRRRPR